MITHIIYTTGFLFVGSFCTSGLIYTVSRDNTVRCWVAKDGRLLRVFQGHLDTISCVEVITARDGAQTAMYTGSYDKTVRKWDIKDGSEVDVVFRGHGKEVRCSVTHRLQGPPH
jgi:WD40 repeat protein